MSGSGTNGVARLIALCVLGAAVLLPLSASAGTTGWIEGTVREPGGGGLAGIQVQAWYRLIDGTWDRFGSPTASRAGGGYTLSGLTGGRTFAVEFLDPGGTYVSEFYDDLPGATAEGATHFVVLADDTVRGIDATLGIAGSVTGTVRNGAGQPVQGIRVNAYRYLGGTSYDMSKVAAWADSGADGKYALVGLGGGSYGLQFHQNLTSYASHYRSATPSSGAVRIENATPVTVSVGTTITGIDETMLKYATLSGSVRTSGGAPLNAVLVEALRFEGGGWSLQTENANSDASGLFSTARHVYPGTYHVSLTLAGYPTQYHLTSLAQDYAADVVIAEDSTVTVDTVMLASDGAAPVSTTTPLPAGWVGTDVVASLSATDGTDGSGVGAIYWRVDSASPVTYTAPATISIEGVHEFGFFAVDRFGNVEPTNTATVMIDKSAPYTESDAPGGWRSGGVTVSLTASDALSGVASTLLGQNGADPTEYAGPLHVTAEGTTTLRFLSVDAVGNRETTRTATVRIDATPPTTTASGFTDGAWRATSAAVTLSPTDAGGSGVASTWHSVDGLVASGTTFTVSGAGTHALAWGSVDAVGNRETTRTATVRIDTVAPVTSAFVTDDDPASPPATVTLSVVETASGLARTVYSINGQPAVTYSGSFPVTRGDEVSFRSEDSAGNVEETRSVTVASDGTPPVTTASGFTDGAWRNTPADVTLSPSDAGGWGIASTWYSVDGLVASGTTFTVGGAGTHSLAWGSVDLAGNRETTRTASVRLDLTYPVTTANAYSGTGSFTLTPSDTGGSGLAGTWYSLDGGSWVSGTSVSAGSGSHTLYFYSADVAGNREATVGPVAFTVAAAPPPPPPPPPPPVATLPKATLLTRPYSATYTRYMGSWFVVWGYLKPRHTAGAYSVTLQADRYEGGKWVRRAGWLAKNSNYLTYTKYSRSIRFVYRGRWRVRAYHSDSGHAPTYSSWSYFTVR